MGHVSTEPKYLLIFFISTLHKESNKAPMKFINKNINLDKRNKQLMFQLFTEDFINSNRSIISDLFYGEIAIFFTAPIVILYLMNIKPILFWFSFGRNKITQKSNFE